MTVGLLDVVNRDHMFLLFLIQTTILMIMMLLLLGRSSYCVVAVYWPNIDHLLYDRLPIQCKQCVWDLQMMR